MLANLEDIHVAAVSYAAHARADSLGPDELDCLTGRWLDPPAPPFTPHRTPSAGAHLSAHIHDQGVDHTDVVPHPGVLLEHTHDHHNDF